MTGKSSLTVVALFVLLLPRESFATEAGELDTGRAMHTDAAAHLICEGYVFESLNGYEHRLSEVKVSVVDTLHDIDMPIDFTDFFGKFKVDDLYHYCYTHTFKKIIRPGKPSLIETDKILDGTFETQPSLKFEKSGYASLLVPVKEYVEPISATEELVVSLSRIASATPHAQDNEGQPQQ